jgi:hypothetical protein
VTFTVTVSVDMLLPSHQTLGSAACTKQEFSDSELRGKLGFQFQIAFDPIRDVNSVVR